MQMVRLKDICVGKGEYGIAASAEDFASNKYRYLRITDISDFGELLNNDCKSVSCDSCEKYLLSEDEIVFARTGNSTGRAFFYEKKYGPLVYAGFLIKFHIDRNKVNPKFLKYYTISKTYKDWIANGSTGSTRGNMSEGDFADMPVFLPSRQVQDSLVAMMEPIDDKINNNTAICSDLEGMAKLLYDYWFVQFDFPDENGKPYKSSGGKMVWNDELKREIPEGWEIKRLIDIESNIITGKTPSTKDARNYNGNIPFITIGDIRGNMFVVSTEQTLSEEGASSQKKKYIPEESLCVTCIASPGLVGFTTQRSQTNQQINSVVFTKDYNKPVLYFSIKQFFDTTVGAKTGNTFANMNKEDFSNIEILYSEDVAKMYYRKIWGVFDKIQLLLEENQQLASLRDFLLPMLMNGQVKIKNTDA